MAREGKKLPLALVGQLPKSRLHHCPQLPQTFVKPKINDRNLQVQNECADYQ
jgi:hypothetical protein